MKTDSGFGRYRPRHGRAPHVRRARSSAWPGAIIGPTQQSSQAARPSWPDRGPRSRPGPVAGRLLISELGRQVAFSPQHEVEFQFLIYFQN
jgi:hypothetical protein